MGERDRPQEKTETEYALTIISVFFASDNYPFRNDITIVPTLQFDITHYVFGKQTTRAKIPLCFRSRIKNHGSGSITQNATKGTKQRRDRSNLQKEQQYRAIKHIFDEIHFSADFTRRIKRYVRGRLHCGRI